MEEGESQKTLVFRWKTMVFEVSGLPLGYQETCKNTRNNQLRVGTEFQTILNDFGTLLEHKKEETKYKNQMCFEDEKQ